MIAILANRAYRRLFAAQAIALLGNGLATVALGLLAYDIAGLEAGAVLGTALAIRMAANVALAPIIGAYTARLPRRAFLVSMDVVRALMVLTFPFVDQIWQIYVLIFVMQTATAGFTPAFQSTIPDLLPDERDYSRALSLSRLAYDLESLASPLLAAVLLTLIDFHWLFSGTAVGFAVSALLVMATPLPRIKTTGRQPVSITRGGRIYLNTPRLRGLLAITLAAAAASAMVIVNTPILVQAKLGREQSDVAIALAAFGGGSMLAALVLPRLLDRWPDRSVMMPAGIAIMGTLAGLAWAWRFHATAGFWPFMLFAWAALGIAYSISVTPGGRLLRRSAAAEDRPALFAAQFALSHLCWLISYPLAGLTGTYVGMEAAFAASALLALIGVLLAAWLWPAKDVVAAATER